MKEFHEGLRLVLPKAHGTQALASREAATASSWLTRIFKGYRSIATYAWVDREDEQPRPAEAEARFSGLREWCVLCFEVK
jgi:hypothetical protein